MPALKPKPENLVANLVCNVALPTALLTWASGERALGPQGGLLVALAFPLGYALHDYRRRRRLNSISLIGFLSVLITGGFGLLKLDGFWFAVKEGAVPALIGAAVLVSLRTKAPLVHELLYNPQVIDIPRVDAALAERGTQTGFDRLLVRSSQLLAVAFGVSAGLNYGLARLVLRSPSGTEAFNAELARMQWMSWPVIVLPSTAMMLIALWRLLRGLEGLTGLKLDEILHQPPAAPGATAAPARAATAEPKDRGA